MPSVWIPKTANSFHAGGLQISLSWSILGLRRTNLSAKPYPSGKSKRIGAPSMATATIDEKRLRGIVKSAIADAFEENRELMQDIVQEALEDIAIVRAIEQGLETKSVSRKKVITILEGGR